VDSSGGSSALITRKEREGSEKEKEKKFDDGEDV
jgi:hypothetical protein